MNLLIPIQLKRKFPDPQIRIQIKSRIQILQNQNQNRFRIRIPHPNPIPVCHSFANPYPAKIKYRILPIRIQIQIQILQNPNPNRIRIPHPIPNPVGRSIDLSFKARNHCLSALLLLAADRRRGVTAEDIGAGGAIEFEAGVTLEIGDSTISDLTGNEGLLSRSGTVTNGGAFEAGVTLEIG